MPDATLPPLARPVPAGAVPDLVGRVRLLLAAAPAAAAVPALVVRERVVVVVVGAAAVALALGLARLTVLLLLLVPPPELPLIREGDSGVAAAAWAFAVAAAAASWLLLLPLLPLGLPLGDNDPAAGGLKPNRLTPFAVGGLTFEGVRAAGCCCCADVAAVFIAAGACGAGADVLLSAEVRGERAVSPAACCCCWGCFPAGVPDAEPVERRMLPSTSFSLSWEARRGLRRVPCLESNMTVGGQSRCGKLVGAKAPTATMTCCPAAAAPIFPVGKTQRVRVPFAPLP